MKTILASAVALILGLGLGCYFEHHHAQREKTDIIQQMVEGIENSDGEHTARAARAIEFIDLGETQQAVQLLSGPVARYYATYGAAGADDRRSRVRSLIEALARTNQVVASRIAEATTNPQIRAR